MKKIIFAVMLLIVTSVGIVFAAPINNLDRGQTAVGFVRDDFYVEHKLTNALTVGLQDDDIYGQFNLRGNYRAIIGSRDYDSDSHFYGGVAVTTALAPALDGYASVIAGSSFAEFQVGANYSLTHNFDLNVNYCSFRPDEGRNKNRVGIGATLKF
ncbi:hypothetical protein [Sporomusa sp.]|uniref:hypothetical protein n=1 Tax=Sporomusa sp. TaxID=2078658 RepID=UPI002C676C3F|nr:hypothetical protein [Sporomusa sp.]HWR07640.1 hypothetical protein [Sporomusa sp.]